MPASKPPFQRLLDGIKADKNSECWLWSGHTYTNGYGAIKVFGKMSLAHRLSYELHKGPIPEGMHILHSCDVRRCVNPDHLRAGTHAENMSEAASRGRMPSGSNHSNYGKPQKRPNQANRVSVLGKEYESQKAAERDLGLGSGTVRYWIKTNPAKAKIISKGKYNA